MKFLEEIRSIFKEEFRYDNEISQCIMTGLFFIIAIPLAIICFPILLVLYFVSFIIKKVLKV